MASAARTGEALAAVLRRDHRIAHLEHALVIVRIDDHSPEIEGPPDHSLAAVAFLEGPPAIFRHVQRGTDIFDERINLARIIRRKGDFDPAPRLVGQALGIARIELGPGAAGIARFHHPAARRRLRPIAARAEGVALAAEVPGPREQAIMVARVHCHGRTTGRQVRALDDQRPGAAAIDRLVQAAVGAVRPQAARRADIDRVAVLGIDQHARDPLAVGQADPGPGLAAIDRFIDAIADRDRVAGPAFAGPDPHHFGIARVDRDIADRLHRLAVEYWAEAHPAIFGLPDPAGRGADKQGSLAIGFAARGERRDPARHLGRTDVADAKPGNRA